eukprot:jgi/Botrbrau1/8534/Bobra.0029s0037.2
MASWNLRLLQRNFAALQDQQQEDIKRINSRITGCNVWVVLRRTRHRDFVNIVATAKMKTTFLILLALAPFIADARSLLQGQESVNLIATIVAGSVTFSGSDYGAQTVTMTSAEPIVTYQVTAGEPHGGVWGLNQVTSKFINGLWLGAPDAALYGYNNYGEQVIMILGALSNPSLNGDTLTFTAQILSPEDTLARVNGVSNYVQAGKGGRLVTDPPQGPLQRIALMVDLAISTPMPGSATTAQQELDAVRVAPPGRRGPFTGRG